MSSELARRALLGKCSVRRSRLDVAAAFLHDHCDFFLPDFAEALVLPDAATTAPPASSAAVLPDAPAAVPPAPPLHALLKQDLLDLFQLSNPAKLSGSTLSGWPQTFHAVLRAIFRQAGLSPESKICDSDKWYLVCLKAASVAQLAELRKSTAKIDSAGRSAAVQPVQIRKSKKQKTRPSGWAGPGWDVLASQSHYFVRIFAPACDFGQLLASANLDPVRRQLRFDSARYTPNNTQLPAHIVKQYATPTTTTSSSPMVVVRPMAANRCGAFQLAIDLELDVDMAREPECLASEAGPILVLRRVEAASASAEAGAAPEAAWSASGFSPAPAPTAASEETQPTVKRLRVM